MFQECALTIAIKPKRCVWHKVNNEYLPIWYWLFGCVVKCLGLGSVWTIFCDGAGGGPGFGGAGAGIGTIFVFPDISASFVRASCDEKSLLSDANSTETYKKNAA